MEEDNQNKFYNKGELIMAIIHLFHGTSGNNMISILKSGFNSTSKKTVWDCSNSYFTYLYDMDKFIESEGYDREDYTEEEFIAMCAQRANEQAQIIAALEKDPAKFTAVFEFIIDTDKVDMDEIEPDTSCENMESCGAVQIYDKTLDAWMTEGLVKVRIHEYEFLPKLSLAYLVGVNSNTYLNSAIDALSDTERKILDTMEGNNCYFLDDLTLCIEPTRIINYL